MTTDHGHSDALPAPLEELHRLRLPGNRRESRPLDEKALRRLYEQVGLGDRQRGHEFAATRALEERGRGTPVRIQPRGKESLAGQRIEPESGRHRAPQLAELLAARQRGSAIGERREVLRDRPELCRDHGGAGMSRQQLLRCPRAGFTAPGATCRGEKQQRPTTRSHPAAALYGPRRDRTMRWNRGWLLIDHK